MYDYFTCFCHSKLRMVRIMLLASFTMAWTWVPMVTAVDTESGREGKEPTRVTGLYWIAGLPELRVGLGTTWRKSVHGF